MPRLCYVSFFLLKKGNLKACFEHKILNGKSQKYRYPILIFCCNKIYLNVCPIFLCMLKDYYRFLFDYFSELEKMFSVETKKEGAHTDSIWSCDWGRLRLGDVQG